jgi:hypothetical protein
MRQPALASHRAFPPSTMRRSSTAQRPRELRKQTMTMLFSRSLSTPHPGRMIHHWIAAGRDDFVSRVDWFRYDATLSCLHIISRNDILRYLLEVPDGRDSSRASSPEPNHPTQGIWWGRPTAPIRGLAHVDRASRLSQTVMHLAPNACVDTMKTNLSLYIPWQTYHASSCLDPRLSFSLSVLCEPL